jgi:hypothetical protein
MPADRRAGRQFNRFHTGILEAAEKFGREQRFAAAAIPPIKTGLVDSSIRKDTMNGCSPLAVYT